MTIMMLWRKLKTRVITYINLKGTIKRQSETIKDCHARYAELAVKYHDATH